MKIMNDDHCKNCGAPLTEPPEPERREWFILCLRCNAKNIVDLQALEIIKALAIAGWHE